MIIIALHIHTFFYLLKKSGSYTYGNLDMFTLLCIWNIKTKFVVLTLINCG
jgi:hypothetical protein